MRRRLTRRRNKRVEDGMCIIYCRVASLELVPFRWHYGAGQRSLRSGGKCTVHVGSKYMIPTRRLVRGSAIAHLSNCLEFKVMYSIITPKFSKSNSHLDVGVLSGIVVRQLGTTHQPLE